MSSVIDSSTRATWESWKCDKHFWCSINDSIIHYLKQDSLSSADLQIDLCTMLIKNVWPALIMCHSIHMNAPTFHCTTGYSSFFYGVGPD